MKLLSIVGMVCVCGAAWAQGAPPAAKKAPPAAPPAATKPPQEKMPEMKPDPALKAEYGMMIGTWKCTGKGTFGGHEFTSTAQYKAEWHLEGFAVVAHYDGKSPGMPEHKEIDVYGYDPTTKMFTNFSADNSGSWSNAKSKGWSGDSEEWTGTGLMMGKASDVKWTITKMGDKEIHVKVTMGADTFEDDCKK